MKTSKALKVILAVVAVGLMAGGASAIVIDYNLTVGLGDSRAIGDVSPTQVPGGGDGGQPGRDVMIINTLLGVAPNTTATIGTRVYQRSGNFSYVLPADQVLPTTVGHTDTPDGFSGFYGNDVLITLDQKWRYLIGGYDGEKSGVEVWDISDIAAGSVIAIPRYAMLTGFTEGNNGNPGALPLVEGKFQMTGYGLYNPISTPDGGLTVGLLGMALGAMGLLMRKIT